MRRDLIEFGKYKDRYWEDIVYKDRNYVEWAAKGHGNLQIQEIAQFWLDTISESSLRSEVSMPVIYSDNELKVLNITKNSENVIVEKLGKDDARQLAYNILALTEV